MTAENAFLETLKMHVRQPVAAPLIGTVKEVDGATCSVELVESQTVITDVLLAASADTTKGWVVTPAIDSAVVVAPVGNNENRLYVAHYTEIQQVEGQIDNCRLHMDKNGFTLERDGIKLMSVLAAMIDEINKIIVVHGTSINVGAMENIKQDLNTLLKE